MLLNKRISERAFELKYHRFAMFSSLIPVKVLKGFLISEELCELFSFVLTIRSLPD